ncbi:unnamed protein product [marine sediment metagenome]|uniref:Uncharacterized protein n=1 Tax=marine sediment metagenome TaxID=412755 RepID=X0SC73_9ZZZZ
MTIEKFPREALADLLRRMADHAEKYECTMSMEFDGVAYRVSVTGEGEMSRASTDQGPIG